MPVLLVLVALMLVVLLLGLVGFAAVREGGVNENTLSPPFPVVRALEGPGWLSACAMGSRVSLGGGGLRESRPCPALSLAMGLSSGRGSGKEKAGALGISPSSPSQGKAEDGGCRMWFGVSGVTCCEPTPGCARELQLRSQSF